jgi:cytochrome c oxidase subunit 1
MPRRYHYYYIAPEWQIYNVLSTAGSTVLGIGFLMPVFYLLKSLKSGPIAGPNPWGATGLEWEAASSPPITLNFEGMPKVVGPVYNYDAIEDSESYRREMKEKVTK